MSFLRCLCVALVALDLFGCSTYRPIGIPNASSAESPGVASSSRSEVGVGDWVRVVLHSGVAFSGRVASFDSQVLVIEESLGTTPGARRMITRDEIASIRVRKRNAVASGVVAVIAVGVVAFAWAIGQALSGGTVTR